MKKNLQIFSDEPIIKQALKSGLTARSMLDPDFFPYISEGMTALCQRLITNFLETKKSTLYKKKNFVSLLSK